MSVINRDIGPVTGGGCYAACHDVTCHIIMVTSQKLNIWDSLADLANIFSLLPNNLY